MLTHSQKMFLSLLLAVNLVGYQHHAAFAQEQPQLTIELRYSGCVAYLMNRLKGYNYIEWSRQ
jgi:hypothetical protein